MKIGIVKKKTGYFVGFGGLNENEIKIIAKLRLPDGTYKLDGIKDYLGIWTNDDGNIDIERSRWFADFSVAYKWGKKRREKAIWDCERKRSIWLVKKKDGKLIKHTKNKQFECWIYEE